MSKQTSTSKNNVISCSHCGYQNVIGSRFCNECGNALEAVGDKVVESLPEVPHKNKVKYCSGCGSEVYGRFCPNCGAEVWSDDWKIKVTGVNAEEVQTVARSLAGAMSPKRKSRTSNPWISGSFYLAAMIILLSLLLAVAKMVHPLVLPIVIIGAILAVSLIGAFQLRQDKSLNEKNFLKLMLLTFKQLPFVGKKE
jgi:RNA polymerase subunit RPABC4/transcription elongation factor Spt4